MRQKTVTYDGASFTISPLTLAQVEQFISPLPKEGDVLRAGKVRAFDLLCWALNNANPEQKWDHERIRQELDPWVFAKLQDEILEFTGLKRIVPGEKPAASEDSSRKSEAASLQ
jgi:hypothetical protein